MNSREVNAFLNNLVNNFPPYELSEQDKDLFKNDEVAFILNKLTRKKFRKHKVTDKAKKDIENKINESIEKQIPIHLTIPFGGYKHFWNPSHPEPDWAEIFTINHLFNLVSPILSAYKPGVIVEFISEDLILPRMNNYPPEALDRYSNIFQKLIDIFNKNTPDNFTLSFFRVGDRCDKDKIIQKVEGLLKERKKDFIKLGEKDKEKELKRSVRSIMWKGKEDLTHLNAVKKIDREIDSRIIELAYYDTEAEPELLGDYLWGDNHICICFSFGLSHDNIDDFLTLGSCKSSIVDYWIGRGILEAHDDKMFPRITSKKQHHKIKKNLKEFKINKVLPFKNYQSIEVLDKVFD